MYEAKVRVRFSAAHYLREYPGNCANLHGHNWTVVAAVRSPELDELGFVVDFRILKKKLKEIISEIDHSLINDHDYFNEINPSSENIAKWVYDRLKKEIENPGLILFSIELGETEDSIVTYFG